jgi:hypothetical protein
MEKLEISSDANYDSFWQHPPTAGQSRGGLRDSMGRHFFTITVLATTLFLAIVPAIGAQQADRSARVFVAVAPGPGADVAYGSLLSDALAVSLTRSHMRPTTFATAGDARSAAGKDAADYLVFGTWVNTAETLELSLEAWLPGSRTPLATGKASGKIGLALDDVVGEALAGVLPALQTRFPAESTTTATGTTVTAIGPSDGNVATVQPPSRWRRVELSLGGAPLVATGDLADYTKLGACAALDLDLRFRAGRGVLAAGLQAGAGWFRAAGVGVADILVIPAGPDVHWTLSADTNPTVSLHAAAGPAVLVAFIGGAGTLAKVSPFVSGGLGVDIALAPALGLRLEADYLVVFEGSMVLQGFTPRLSLRTRF